jgi:hypothetical protein
MSLPGKKKHKRVPRLAAHRAAAAGAASHSDCYTLGASSNHKQ